MRNGKIVRNLVVAVTSLQADVSWIKKLIYVVVGSSLTATLAVAAQLVVGMVRR